MILTLSTSSALASVCLVTESGKVCWAGCQEAPGRAGEACIEMISQALKDTSCDLHSISLFASDQGPGSFTGVRVGVIMAKTFAWCSGVECAGVSAFDLICRDSPVAIPSRKGEFFLRVPGEEPIITSELPVGTCGYGFGDLSTFPDAKRIALLLPNLLRVSPYALAPEYRMEPSISTPRRPLSRVSG